MSRSDSRAIEKIVNRAHAGRPTYLEIKDADHLLSVHDKLSDQVVSAIVDWMRSN